jgi:hypothetical protein
LILQPLLIQVLLHKASAAEHPSAQG